MSLAVIDEHRDVLSELRRLAVTDLGQVVALIRGLDVAEARELLKGAIPDLMDPFMGAASDAAAVLLDELYVSAGRRAPALSPAPLLEDSRVDALARWAVGPMGPDPKVELRGIVPEPDFDAVLSRLTGAATRSIFNSSRLTVIDSVTRDPTGKRVTFQRMPRADCCAFCGMLASRPLYMAYRTEDSAGQVIGRGSTRTGFDDTGKRLVGGIGGGIHARGTQSLEERYHDDCRCVAVPLLKGPTADAIEASRDKFEEMYRQSLTDEQGNPRTNLKQILAEWRTLHGTH